MCGIAGYYSSDYFHDGSVVTNVLNSLFHRGPDGHGMDVCDLGFMIHTRLSILDPGSGGHQPFRKFDGNVISAHNGEIYNHVDLRKELSDEYSFDGQSDSEIIPLLYRKLGPDLLCKRLEGMFAFVVFDRKNRAVYLCRDTFGIKPLYYSLVGKGIAFGSEMKALTTMSCHYRKVRTQAVYDFLCLGYIPEPETIYEDISAIPRGSYLKFSLDSSSIEIHNYAPSLTTPAESCDMERLDSLFNRVIVQQSVADFPVGSLLSGGVDSTLVSAYYAQCTEHPKTFTVAFNTLGRDESHIASSSAYHIGSKHTEINIGSSIEWDTFNKLLLHFDQPFGDLSFLPTYVVCDEVRKQVKVVLTGDGGDEFAGGYAKFRHFRNLLKLQFIPRSVRVFLYKTAKSLGLSFRVQKFLRLSTLALSDQIYGLSVNASENLVRSFFKRSNEYTSPVRFFSYDPKLDYTQNISLNQCNTSLLSKMLPKVDRMSMLAGIEARVPLLDTRLTRCLFSLTPSEKLHGKVGKFIFRKLLRTKVPKYSNREKTGFDFDHREITAKGWTSRMIENIKRSQASENRLWRILDSQPVSQWLVRYEAGEIVDMSRQSQFQMVVNLYALVVWFEKR
jgi:asparagine synthase (glutamine-hydrolysing)